MPKKYVESKVKVRPNSSSAGLSIAFRHRFSFATVLAANFGCDQLKLMSEIVSEFLRTTIWIGRAALESRQKSNSWAGAAGR